MGNRWEGLDRIGEREDVGFLSGLVVFARGFMIPDHRIIAC